MDAKKQGAYSPNFSAMSDATFVLVVDADADRGGERAELLKGARLLAHAVPTFEEALESLQVRPPQVLLAHQNILMNGLDWGRLIKQVRSAAPESEILLVTSSDAAAEAQLKALDRSLQPYDLLVEPLEGVEWLDRVRRAGRQAAAARDTRRLALQAEHAFDVEGIVGVSEALRRLLQRIKKIARSKSTVLIAGETGTGKELFAQAIHAFSPRSGKPFKVLNCAAVSETLLESELFGHVKGAFTGAVTDRKGLLVAADGGTMFLDEIGDMPLTMQAKLLRVLENGEVIPVGSNDALLLDVRFVAATNRDLIALREEGRFREDLFYRLYAHGTIRIPPLRERPEDVPILVDLFIRRFNEENGLSIEGITPEALSRLMGHAWEGNVRELRHVVERMCIECEGNRLDVEDLPEMLQTTRSIIPLALPGSGGVLTLAQVEELHIRNTLRLFGGNRDKTAQALDISPRTLYRKLREYGIT